MGDKVAKDKYNQEIKNGDIINIHQTVNGCRFFVIINIDDLDVRYYDNNHQGIGLNGQVSVNRKYEYDVEELLDMKPGKFGFIESEIEVVGKLSETDLLELQNRENVMETDYDEMKLNAIKEVIQCIDSGEQDLRDGLYEIDFIINDWNNGEN